MGVKDRIYQFCKEKGIAIRTFELNCGLSNGYVSSMRKGLGIEKLENVLNAYPELSREWLLYGEGEMYKGAYKERIDNTGLVSEPYVDYGRRHQAARPYYAVDFFGGFDLTYNEQKVVPDGVVDIPAYSNADFWVNVTGKSMEPMISSGDLIALKKIEDWRNGIFYGGVYAIVTKDDLRTIKRIRKSDTKGFVKLVPDNKEYDPQDIPMDNIRFVFKVVGAVKNID